MAEIVLLRHSFTSGNLEKRYIGSRTDEPLCPEGKKWLREHSYPCVEQVYASPMKRCLETAQTIWPEMAGSVVQAPDLRECDFGAFENKNYQELSGDPDYQAWIASGGALPFPRGEPMESFKARCLCAFAWIVEDIRHSGAFRAAIVAHGGTVMAIMEAHGFPAKGYFDYQVKNGCGYLLTPVEGTGLWNYQCLPQPSDFCWTC